MNNANNDVLEVTGSTFGMCLVKVDGQFWYGHKLCIETFDECSTKFGPYSCLKEAVKNLDTYLKTYGGCASLSPACFDEQGNPENPDTVKFHKGDDW